MTFFCLNPNSYEKKFKIMNLYRMRPREDLAKHIWPPACKKLGTRDVILTVTDLKIASSAILQYQYLNTTKKKLKIKI